MNDEANRELVMVTLSSEDKERCRELAEQRVAHYRNNGNRLTAMPWTRDQLSDDELRECLASRKDAAAKIDIETCEIGWWYVNDLDKYRIREELGELDPDLIGYSISRTIFVRSPQSNGWVSEADLPVERYQALRRRIEQRGSSLTQLQSSFWREQ